MERFVADLVKSFESGKIDRREFCQTIALAATVYGRRRRPRPDLDRIQGAGHQSLLLHLPGLPVVSFKRDRAVVELNALDVKNVRPLDSNSVHMDDPFGYDVQLSGLGETAFTSGG